VLRKILLQLALAGALAWAGFALLAEMEGAVAGYDLRERASPSAGGWRFGIPQVVRLERFLDAARPLLPRGERVGFTSPPAIPGELFFRYRWAAYLLPEVDLVPWEGPGAPPSNGAPHLLSYSYRLSDPRLALERRLPGGFLYRIRR